MQTEGLDNMHVGRAAPESFLEAEFESYARTHARRWASDVMSICMDPEERVRERFPLKCGEYPIIILQYEDLKRDLLVEMGRLAAFFRTLRQHYTQGPYKALPECALRVMNGTQMRAPSPVQPKDLVPAKLVEEIRNTTGSAWAEIVRRLRAQKEREKDPERFPNPFLPFAM
jgi:hypothetical protein